MNCQLLCLIHRIEELCGEGRKICLSAPTTTRRELFGLLYSSIALQSPTINGSYNRALMLPYYCYLSTLAYGTTGSGHREAWKK